MTDLVKRCRALAKAALADYAMVDALCNRIEALEAELAEERENNAAEFAARTEAQQKLRAAERGQRFGAAFDRAATQEELAKEASHCRKCGAAMKPGIATAQTMVGGSPDLGGNVMTFTVGGPGAVIGCMKCEDCGWSVT